MCLIFKVILSVFLVNAAFADVSHVYGQPGQQYLQPFQQVDAQYPADVQQYAIPSQSDVEHEGYPDNQPVSVLPFSFHSSPIKFGNF